MKNINKILISCLGIVCLIIVSLLFFLLGGSDSGAGLWVVYVLADMVLLCLIIAPWLETKKPATDKNTVRLEEISFIKTNSLKLKAIAQSCENEEIAQKTEELYVKLHSSPSVSCEAAKDSENKIEQAVQWLQTAARDGDSEEANKLIKQIKGLITERDNILRVDNLHLKEEN